MRQLFSLLFTVFAFAQQNSKVDFKKAYANITINPIEKKVSGSVRYVLEVKQAVDTIKIDAQNMTFNAVEMNGKEALFVNSKKQLILFERYKKGKYLLTFTYTAYPKQTSKQERW